MKNDIRSKICEYCSGPMNYFPQDYEMKRKKCNICGNIIRVKGNYPMNTDYYISVVEFLMGRDEKYPPTDEMIKNYNTLIPLVNQLLEIFFIDNKDAPRRNVTSGYRPAEINATIPGAAKKSNHMKCAAVDLGDSDKLLGEWCVKNIDKLKQIGLYMESLSTTHKLKGKEWVHLQIVKTINNPFLP